MAWIPHPHHPLCRMRRLWKPQHCSKRPTKKTSCRIAFNPRTATEEYLLFTEVDTANQFHDKCSKDTNKVCFVITSPDFYRWKEGLAGWFIAITNAETQQASCPADGKRCRSTSSILPENTVHT